MPQISLFVLIILCSIRPHWLSHAETDTLKQGQLFHDWDKLISASGAFVFEFFSLYTSGPCYIGIRFTPVSSVDYLWVANPKNPIPDSSGVVRIDDDGLLKITYRRRKSITINSNQATRNSVSNITATLLGTGNLVLREVDTDGVAGKVLWQSFDFPTDKLLSGMKLGFNGKSGQEWYLSSWLSDQVPSQGAFRLGLDPDGSNQPIVWRHGEDYWTSGVLENGSSQFIPNPIPNVEYEYRFVTNENERYFSYSVNRFNKLSKWVLDSSSAIFRWTSVGPPDFDVWYIDFTVPCSNDKSNACGICLNEKPLKCRNGSEFFVPRQGYMDVNDVEYDEYNAK